MISPSDLLHIINEIHQYSMLLVELRDATTLGISRTASDRMVCFVCRGKLGRTERGKLMERAASGTMPGTVKALSLEQFLQEIEDKKAKHIWLETGGAEPREHGFMSISELKAFFRGHPPR